MRKHYFPKYPPQPQKTAPITPHKIMMKMGWIFLYAKIPARHNINKMIIFFIERRVETSKTLQTGATSENVEYIKVYFNKKGEVVDSKAILKVEGPTSIFKKEVIEKNGQLTKRAIEILKEVAK